MNKRARHKAALSSRQRTGQWARTQGGAPPGARSRGRSRPPEIIAELEKTPRRPSPPPPGDLSVKGGDARSHQGASTGVGLRTVSARGLS